MSGSMNDSVKTWYEETFPNDELGSLINESLSFYGALKALYEEEDFYDALGEEVDSIVRGRVFDELELRSGYERGDIYEAWLGEKNLVQTALRYDFSGLRPHDLVGETTVAQWYEAAYPQDINRESKFMKESLTWDDLLKIFSDPPLYFNEETDAVAVLQTQRILQGLASYTGLDYRDLHSVYRGYLSLDEVIKNTEITEEKSPLYSKIMDNGQVQEGKGNEMENEILFPEETMEEAENINKTVLYKNEEYKFEENYEEDIPLPDELLKMDAVIKGGMDSHVPFFMSSVVWGEPDSPKFYISNSGIGLASLPNVIESVYEADGHFFISGEDKESLSDEVAGFEGQYIGHQFTLEIRQLSKEGYLRYLDTVMDKNGILPQDYEHYDFDGVPLYQGDDWRTKEQDFFDELWNNPQYTVPIHYSERLKAYEQAQEPVKNIQEKGQTMDGQAQEGKANEVVAPKKEFARVNIPAAFVNPRTETTKDGREVVAAFVTMPKGTTVNGIPVGGYSAHVFLDSHMQQQKISGKSVTLKFDTSKDVLLSKNVPVIKDGEKQYKQEKLEVNAWNLSKGIKAQVQGFRDAKSAERAEKPAQTQARGINDLRVEKTQESKALSGGQNYDKAANMTQPSI